jgi:D-lactate dehydrogenase
MNVLLADATPEEARHYSDCLPGFSVRAHAGLLESASRLDEIEILATDVPVSADMLREMPRLRLIAARSTGTDYLDCQEAWRRGVTICNAPVAGISVAEHAFALLLALARRVRTSESEPGFELWGKALGVVGAGRIGRHILRIGSGFGMECMASDPTADRIDGVEMLPLPDLLQRSEILVLACPLTPQTRGLIGERELQSMRRGAVLVNVARGALVDTAALAEALRSGHLGGAALDVVEGESSPVEARMVLEGVSAAVRALATNPNVVLTPHRAFLTREALDRVRRETIANIRAAGVGQTRNIVQPLDVASSVH